MTRRRRKGVHARSSTAAVLLAMVVLPWSANGQRPAGAGEILAILASGNAATKLEAVYEISASPALLTDDRIRLALIDELRKANQERAARMARAHQGEPVDMEPGRTGLNLEVSSLVARLKDPRAIPVLTETPQGSAWRALAAFGDIAVPAMLATWASRASRPELSLVGVLSTLLRAMEATVAEGRIGAESRRQLLAVAREALTRPDDSLVLGAAVGLAAASREPDLVADVERLAADVAEVMRRGIDNVDRADYVQRRARRALATYR